MKPTATLIFLACTACSGAPFIGAILPTEDAAPAPAIESSIQDDAGGAVEASALEIKAPIEAGPAPEASDDAGKPDVAVMPEAAPTPDAPACTPIYMKSEIPSYCPTFTCGPSCNAELAPQYLAFVEKTGCGGAPTPLPCQTCATFNCACIMAAKNDPAYLGMCSGVAPWRCVDPANPGEMPTVVCPGAS